MTAAVPAPLARLLAAAAVLAAVGVARHALGGPESGLSALVVLPVLWLALKGRAWEVAAGTAMALAVVALPVLVLGEPDYPSTEWRRVATLVLVAGLAGAIVHRAVAQLRASERDLEAVAEAARALGHAGDPRREICAASCTVAAAAMAVLAEPDGAGGLVLTAAVGTEIAPGARVEIGDERSGASRAFTAGRRLFVPDLAQRPDLSGGFSDRARLASVLWEPVPSAAGTRGVLMVGWNRRIRRRSDHSIRAVALLAAEAAIAIEREALLAELRDTARTDPLTGLLNRRGWDEELPREIARAERQGRPLCVAVLDVDGFKPLNDTEGHHAGDRALKALAAGWSAAVRRADRLARVGGDEFGIVLPDCSLALARSVLERVQAVRPAGLTCSAGLAQWDRQESAEALLDRADAALYEAKRAGRDRLVVADR